MCITKTNKEITSRKKAKLRTNSTSIFQKKKQIAMDAELKVIHTSDGAEGWAATIRSHPKKGQKQRQKQEAKGKQKQKQCNMASSRA